MKKLIIAFLIVTLTASAIYALTTEQEQDLKRLVETWDKIKVDTRAPMTAWLRADNNSRVATCGLYILAMIIHDKLKIKILDIRGVYDHATLLKESLEKIIFHEPAKEYNLNEMTVGKTILRTMLTLGWI